MAPDPHTGGTLSEMAPTGTSIPNDAGKQNTIPPTANPSDKNDNTILSSQPTGNIPSSSSSSSSSTTTTDPNPLGSRPDRQTGAANALDAPRSAVDAGVTGEVASGTGAAVPGSVETKRLDPGDGRKRAVGAHGKSRDAMAEQHKQGFERLAGGGGAEVQPAPGEEGEAQDVVRERKGL